MTRQGERARGQRGDAAGHDAPVAWGALLAVFALALTLRLAYLGEMRGSLLFSVLLGDGAYFEAWAREIAAGDWLGREVFYQAPLYPYLLALLHRIGAGVPEVRAVQAILGALACVLVADTARRLFDRRVGFVAGLWLAAYAPAIYYEGLVQKTGLALFGLALLLFLLARWRDAPRLARLFPAGVVLGLLALTRENLAVLWFACAAWLFAALAPGSVGARLGAVAVFTLGVALAFLPVVVRNHAVSGEIVLGTTNSGPNLWIGNHAGADGLYTGLRPGRGHAGFEREDATALAEEDAGQPLTAREVSAFWRGRAVDWMRADPAAWLALLARKTWFVFHDREWMDSQSFAVYRAESRVLGGLGRVMRFGVLFPFAVLGLAFAWSERRRLALVYAAIPLVAGSVALFFVFGRFRASLVPLLLPFAACAAVELARRVRVRAWPSLALPAVAFAATSALVHWPPPAAEYPRADTLNNLGSALSAAGRTDEAIQQFELAIEARPDYAAPRFNLGRALAGRGAIDAAVPHLLRAVALEPAFRADAYLTLAEAQARAGRLDRARGILLEAREAEPTNADVRLQLGLIERQLGDAEAAEASYLAAIRLRPTHAAAHNNLGYLYALQGRYAAAAARYARALELDEHYLQAIVNLAWLRACAPDATDRDGALALELAERALRLAAVVTHDLHDLRAAALAELGRFPAAAAVAEVGAAAAAAAGDPVRAAAIRERGALYLANRPFHYPGP